MELRELRDARGWTQARMARLGGMTRQELSRLEHGQAADLADVLNLLDALGIEGERWTALSAIARDAVTPGWWDSIKHIGERQALYANLEFGATTIRQFQQAYLPGLLQLPDYVRSLYAAEQAFGPVSVPIEDSLAGRAGRQRNLRLPGGTALEIVMDEIAILRRAAPAGVTRTQLRHLATVARGSQPNVTLTVLPAEAQLRDHAIPRTPFSIYTYADPGDPTVVAIDTETSDVIMTGVPDVARYEWLYERLREAALAPEESADLLAKAADMLPGCLRLTRS
jgi:transcriptional regulator with XRE-family HTH domain